MRIQLAHAIAMAIAASVSNPAAAEEPFTESSLTAIAGSSVPQNISIPAGDLTEALKSFAKQTASDLVYRPEQVQGLRTEGVSGNLRIREALDQLLKGTKLRANTDSSTGAILIAAPLAAAANQTTHAVTSLNLWAKLEMKLAQNSSAGDGSAVGGENSQASGHKDDAQSDRLEEIIVTAQKREQSVHDVPMAIEVRSGEFIEQTGFVDFQNYARTISNIGFTPSGGRNDIKISLRGISPLTGAPTVAMYVDETLVSGLGNLGPAAAGSVDPRLFDISRVEVLKGPQGHLYGASAMGGVIKIVTNQPKLNEWETRVDATLSDTRYGDANVLLNLAANMPLIDDIAALRVAVSHGQQSGYIDRVSPFTATDAGGNLGRSLENEHDENINSLDTLSMRAALLITPAEWLRITPVIYYQSKEYGGEQGLTPNASGSIDGSPQALLYQDERVKSVMQIFSLTAVADVDVGSVTSNTSYTDFDGHWARDITNFAPAITRAPLTLADTFYFPPYLYNVNSKQWVQELRFVSSWSFPIGLTVGGYYRDNKGQSPARLSAPGAGAHFGLPDDVLVSQSLDGKTTEKAVFGNLTYEFRRIEFQVGARYFDFGVNFGGFGYGFFSGGYAPPVYGTSGTQDSGVNLSTSVSYDLTANHKLYARAAQGFRAGSTGAPPPAVLCGDQVDSNVDSDSVWNYELGAKTRWANGRLTVNAALFQIDYSDVQQSIRLPCAYTIVDNAGAATSKGVELEIAAELLDGLVFNGSMGYVKSTLDTSVPFLGADAGESLLSVPSRTGSASLAYTRGTSIPALDATFRADWSYSSESAVNFGGIGIGPTRFTDPYTLLSLRAGVSHKEGWQASIFVDNVMDKRADLGPSDFGMPLVFINQPRTIGINFKREF